MRLFKKKEKREFIEIEVSTILSENILIKTLDKYIQGNYSINTQRPHIVTITINREIEFSSYVKIQMMIAEINARRPNLFSFIFKYD